MSEPQTSAKVIIYTVKGRIDVELWAKEKPIHCRRFLEACQTGLLTDESLNELSHGRDYIMISKVYDMGSNGYTPLEHNARIRWRTGTLGWDGLEQKWFISLAPFSDDSKKVAIGKIVDDSVYSLRKIIDESEIGPDGKLLYPATIRKVEVTIPFFDDLPAAKVSKLNAAPKHPLKKAVRVRISFDDEDDEEDGPIRPMKRMRIKMPAAIADSQSAEQLSADYEPDSHTQEVSSHEEGDNGEDNGLHIAKAEQSSQKEGGSTICDRERETLKLLALFEEKVKGKNILSR